MVQIVVGSGPAAQKCAIDSVKRGKRVALVDKNSQMGGVCVHTGTIPSKTFREAVLHLTGYRHQASVPAMGSLKGRRATAPLEPLPLDDDCDDDASFLWG
jgi:pyruvate/2-oxoglutarate dehydrogenase complex dihydrolipoamide dehydrogenase (E3) component